MKQLLKELCAIDGVSGREAPVRAYIEQKLRDLPQVEKMLTDPSGNLLVWLRGRQRAAKKLVLAAHMDEVGLLVTGITDDGFLRVATVGGLDQAVLFGKRVRIGQRRGVIGGKPIHMCKEDEKKQLPRADQLLVDIGADTREQAEALVAVGDAVAFDSDFVELGQLVKAKALDDRAGCALLLTLAQQPPAYDLMLAFTTQEEIGLRGAQTAAYTLQPELAVIVDATTAADTVGVEPERQVCHVGGGGVVSFMDRQTLYDKALYDTVMTTAATHGLAAQPKCAVAGGNDAGAFQRARGGARVAAVSLPCRYIHSPSCVLSMKDMEQTLALLRALTEELPV